MSEDYRSYAYVIAGEEALEMIDYIKQKAENARQRLIEIADENGATLSFSDYNQPIFDFDGPPPEGWTEAMDRAGTYTTMDMESEKGQELNREFAGLAYERDVQARFNDLCHQLAPCVHRGNFTFTFQEFGDDTVIKCPKDMDGASFIPPGSQQIPFLDYIKMKLEAEQHREPVVKPFTNKFEP